MDTRTVGVEEELLVVDPATRAVTSRAREVLSEHDEHGRGNAPRSASDELDKELFRHQLEIRTDPTRDVDDIVAQVVAGRRTAGEAAEALELAVAVCASVPLAMDEPVISDNERYRDMAETFGQVARRGTTCGMHVHVAIESPEEGVALHRPDNALVADPAGRQHQLALRRGARHRLRLVAHPAVVHVAQRRSDRAVRLDWPATAARASG